ncbi:hypothetical protein JA1_002154 [Spathaspora sp. JA1]|nr:hypothetical protein JA1_002154 [Spathaspora sp. JA1]
MATYERKNKNKRIRLSSNPSLSSGDTTPTQLNKPVKNVKPKPKKIQKKKIEPNKVEPKKPDNVNSAWDDLFSSIQEQPVVLQPNITSDSEESGTDDDNTAATNSYIEIDFDSITKEITPVSSSQPPREAVSTRRTSKPNQKNTYASDRTYLAEDNVYFREELTNEISSRHDFNNEESMLNVNDLRTSTKSPTTLDYILEGLTGGTGPVIISSLLELLNLVSDVSPVEMNKIIVAIRVLKWDDEIVTKLMSMVYYRISMNCEDNFELSVLSSVLDKVILGLELTIDTSGLSKVNQTLARPYINSNLDIKFIERIQKEGLISWSVCLAILELLTTTQQDNLELLQILETYFQDSNDIGLELELITPIFQQTFVRIESEQYTKADHKIIKIFILLTTNYDKRIIQDICDCQYALTMFKFLDKCYSTTSQLSLCLLVLGLLLNLTEWNLYDIDTSIITKNMSHLEQFSTEEHSQLTPHIIGYNAIILTNLQLKYNNQLKLNKTKLKAWLIDFQPTKAISDKISILLQSI